MASQDNHNNQALASRTHGVGEYHSALVGASQILSNVNSTAVVQVHPHMFPVQFHTIRLNTDLNHLPQDWANTKLPAYERNTSHQNAFSNFTSVNLAHRYKDLVGRVDVISSSKNIKDLLKMPYQQSPHISLMVHRLGKTLLLEEFDVHKNLMKKGAEDWKWLDDFICRYVNKQEDKQFSLVPLNSPKKDLLSDEMYRNLIRHSITASVASRACISMEANKDVPHNVHYKEEELQDLKGFRHESLWKFHDRSMLVDSDLPIFGTDSKCPCISLRLRDSPPINVLTGLDYWLDNLMSNVPEVAMVYHLNGFVQKYEILRTEDIPHIENSNFDPEEVMELARNVMAFIKSRAVVEGHTYWLYKSENDDMVKLYDLTEYCKKELRKDDNPFTVPVGLLCYHVGRNLKMSNQRRSADCRAMLENCLRLLIEEDHPQICADVHFLLADMWVPDKSLYDIWQGDGKIADPPDDLYEEDLGDCDNLNVQEQAEHENNVVNVKNMSLREHKLSPQRSPRKRENKNEVALKELVVRGMIKRKAWDVLKVCKIAGETDERCRSALHHIRKGLQCIDKDLSRKAKQKAKGRDAKYRSSANPSTTHQDETFCQNADIERDQLVFAKPCVPIPMRYSPLSHTNGNTSSTSGASEKQWQESKSDESTDDVDERLSENGDSNSQTAEWHSTLKLQLLRKAAITFYILADQFHGSLMRRGHTLRYVRYGMHCYECLFVNKPKRTPSLMEEEVNFHLTHLAAKARSCLDCSIWASSQKDFEELSEVEAAILHSAQAILPKPAESWVYKWPESEEKNLKTARELYKKLMNMKAFEKKPTETRNIVRRQIGVCLMNTGSVFLTKLKFAVIKNSSFESIEPLIEKGLKAYKEAVSYFLKNNERNTAGHCSTHIAYLYEQAALCLEKNSTNAISDEEQKLIQKMFEACEETLSIYGRDESADAAKEDMYNFMRERYYKAATRCFPFCSEDIEAPVFKYTKELMHKALSYCFLDPENRYAMKSYKVAASIHYNLGRFHRKECLKHRFDSPRHVSLRRKMYDHLHEAYTLYTSMRWSMSQIAVKNFLVSLIHEEYDYRSNEKDKHDIKAQRKMLRHLLMHCCELQSAVDFIHTEQADKDDDTNEILSTRQGLQISLDMMNKIFIKWLKIEKSTDLYRPIKEFYQTTLKLTTKKEEEFIAYPLSQLITNVRTFLTSDAFSTYCN